MDLYSSVSNINGIGPKSLSILDNLGIRTVIDLLNHAPFRYEDRTKIKKISELIPNEKVSVIGIVDRIDNIFTPNRKRLTKTIISDDTGKLNVIWFNQHYITNTLKAGLKVILFGEIDPNNKKPQFISPEWEIIDSDEQIQNNKIMPVYNLTEGITNKWLRKKIDSALKSVEIEEIFDKKTLVDNNLIYREKAYKNIHFPDSFGSAEISKKRLSFDELTFIHLRGIMMRKEWEKKKNSHQIKLSKSILDNFISNLSFKLTDDQLKSIKEVLEDLKGQKPMNRLLQGDVGSGKTIVSIVALLACCNSGFNSIYMAPTQILAEQHFATISKILNTFNVEIILLTGKKRQEITEPHKNYIVIATHSALHHLEEFNNIGLIVIDEQHKFGVDQRTKIVDYYSKKSESGINTIPNLLTMTATPIPRSMALTIYGDLDLSLINQMPINRKKVKTWVINEHKRLSAYEWISKHLKQTGHQAFIVCPFIEESDNINFRNVKAAEVEFKKLSTVFSDFKLGLLHGRLSNTEKEKVITDFIKRKTNILVTTPVIEVGIDIPNANIILIETPERFGLASLHQLRGRVGRGGDQAYCILLNSNSDGFSSKRLKHMENIHNGNKLAEIDLQLRGPGDIYGTNQHGFLDLKIADITDFDLMKTTKNIAINIFSNLDKFQQIKKEISKIKYVEEN